METAAGCCLLLILLTEGMERGACSLFTKDDIIFDPPSGSRFYTQSSEGVSILVSKNLVGYVAWQQERNSTFLLSVDVDVSDKYTQDVAFVRRKGEKQQSPSSYPVSIPVETFISSNEHLPPNSTASQLFIIDSVGIGYGKLIISILEQRDVNITETLVSEPYQLSSVRRLRGVDIGFNTFVTILAVVNAFALGSLTDMNTIREQLERKAVLTVAMVTHYLIVPLVTFSMTRALDVQNELAIGFLLVSCIPGGGLGYLIVAVTKDTDVALSLVLNTFHVFIPLGTIPLFVYSLCQVMPNQTGAVTKNTYLLVLWVLVLTVPYICGVMLRKRNESLSHAFLNWLIKPLLLLSFILFMTLGLYINMYIFRVLSNRALITGGILPFVGFTVGAFLSAVTRNEKKVVKTVAIEATIVNSLAAIIAIRFTLPSPDSDLASAAVMWVLFITPSPFFLLFIFHKIKRKVMSYFEKKELEKEKQETILQSFANITQNAIQLGGLNIDQSALYTNDEISGDMALLIRSTSNIPNAATLGNGENPTLQAQRQFGSNSSGFSCRTPTLHPKSIPTS